MIWTSACGCKWNSKADFDTGRGKIFSCLTGAIAPRASVLNEARDLITGDRNNQYGPPTQDFARTADLLNALGYQREDATGMFHNILASDVALIIAQVKVSRLMHSRGKRDSWVDLAGYAGCGYECAVEEAGAP